MIVSLEHRFIFVAIPKTGTHAIRQALRHHLGPDDMEQAGLFVQKSFPIAELARLQHGHFSLQQVRPYLPPEKFASYFKFAFVRNPFDRFISYCAFMSRALGQFEADPKRVMRHYIDHPPLQHVLFQPQHLFLDDGAGELLTDYVGRVETMQHSFDEIAARIGIPSERLQRINTTSREDYRTYYDDQLVAGVAKLYARDLELFAYEF